MVVIAEIGCVAVTEKGEITKRSKQMPGQAYHEKSSLSPPKHWEISVGLVFPNTYYVGMSNLGFQFLYRLFCLTGGVLCERVFLPDAGTLDMMSPRGNTLTSFESHKPVGAFDILAFSISFENDYVNILKILSLSNIPLLQQQRSEMHPLIVGGGISVMLNPEPLADFFDMLMIGEAEELVGEFIDLFRKNRHDRRRGAGFLESFKDIKGVYIPSGYRVDYESSGKIATRTGAAGYPGVIESRKVSDIEKFNPCSCIVTPHTEFSDMTLVEINRGCPRACRFCAVGQLYKPYRKRGVETLIKQIELHRDVPRIGILGSAISDHPDVAGLIRYVTDKKGSVSLSSFRADKLTDTIAENLKRAGVKSFTIAPEAATQRLRDAVGKQLSDEEIFRAVAILAANRIRSIKLYFIAGLPFETDRDIEAIPEMVRKIKHVYTKVLKSDKALNRITVSLSIFVPKPWTPFQWHVCEDKKNVKKKLKYVVQRLKKESRVFVVHEMPKWAYLQTLLSRGDRRTGALLLQAFNNRFDWNITLRGSGLNPDFFVYRQTDPSEILPWDFIDHGISKKRLWNEYRKVVETYGNHP